MSLINYTGREINVKIVYYGPGLSGKTTNLEFIHRKLKPGQKGKLISLATETDRTLFFDFLPVHIGDIKGFQTKFHLYTVPGQVHYNETRKTVLKGADGVIFVADSQPQMIEENKASLQNLHDNLKEYNLDLKELPFVIQYNKRDLEGAMNVEELDRELNHPGVPTFEAVAIEGQGVLETFACVSKLTLKALRGKETLEEEERAEEDELFARLMEEKKREEAVQTGETAAEAPATEEHLFEAGGEEEHDAARAADTSELSESLEAEASEMIIAKPAIITEDRGDVEFGMPERRCEGRLTIPLTVGIGSNKRVFNINLAIEEVVSGMPDEEPSDEFREPAGGDEVSSAVTEEGQGPDDMAEKMDHETEPPKETIGEEAEGAEGAEERDEEDDEEPGEQNKKRSFFSRLFGSED